MDLNDLCEFRVEIPNNPEHNKRKHILKIETRFGDLNGIGGVEKLPECVNNLMELITFKTVGTKKFVMNEIENGISQYIGIQNDGHYFGLCNMTVHTAVIDFRYRGIISKDRSEVSKSFCDYLIPNENKGTTMQVEPDAIDKIYTKYVCALVNTYSKISENFFEIKERCLTKKQQRENRSTLMVKNLEFPDERNIVTSVKSLTFKKIDNEETKQSACANKDICFTAKGAKNTFIGNYCENDANNEMHFRTEDSFEDTDEQIVRKSIALPLKPNKMPKFEGIPISQKLYTLEGYSNRYECANKFVFNITFLSGQVLELWHRYIELLTITPKLVKEMLYIKYLACIRQKKYANLTVGGHSV